MTLLLCSHSSIRYHKCIYISGFRYRELVMGISYPLRHWILSTISLWTQTASLRADQPEEKREGEHTRVAMAGPVSVWTVPIQSDSRIAVNCSTTSSCFSWTFFPVSWLSVFPSIPILQPDTTSSRIRNLTANQMNAVVDVSSTNKRHREFQVLTVCCSVILKTFPALAARGPYRSLISLTNLINSHRKNIEIPF